MCGKAARSRAFGRKLTPCGADRIRARQYLNGDAFDVALDLLKRSEELTDPRRYATDDNERMKIRAVRARARAAASADLDD